VEDERNPKKKKEERKIGEPCKKVPGKNMQEKIGAPLVKPASP
jgi:hypothetical protein